MDLIDRQEAIDALGEKPLAWIETEYETGLQNQWESDVEAIKSLPSAQPELTDEDKRLIKKLRSYHNGSYAKVIDKLIASAQPMRKKGRWIDETFKPWGLVHHPYKCDQCGEHSEANSNFCPNCGCQMMRGDAD